jgi:uridylate kinase
VKDPQAVKYDRLSFADILEKELKIVDATAASLCMEYDVPLIVFNIRKEDVLARIMSGEPLGTLVKGRMPC